MKTLLALLAFAGALAAAPPNVLFLVVDDLHASLGSYGESTVKTPNLDRLLARGVRFDRAYCQFPLCNPSRTSFLSGLRPETSGAIQQEARLRESKPDVVFLPGWFKQHGYFAAGAGKVFHKNDEASWDAFEESKPRNAQEVAAMDSRSSRRKNGEAGAEWMPLDCRDEETGDGMVAKYVADFMSEGVKQGKPFFIAAGFRKPHLPWTAPKSYFAMYPPKTETWPTEPEMKQVPRIALQTDISGAPAPSSRGEAVAAYHACVSFMDAQVGVLMARMDELKLWDSTIVVFLSDHGYHLGDHGGLWAKLTTFERCSRVPFAIVLPHAAQTGACRAIVESIDLYPTLCEACGLERPPGIEGRSLMPLLKDVNAPWDHPAYTVTVHEGVIGRSIRADRWRYTEWNDGAQGIELYDQLNDGENYRNLAGDPGMKDTIAALKSQLGAIPRYKGAIPDSVQNHHVKKPKP